MDDSLEIFRAILYMRISQKALKLFRSVAFNFLHDAGLQPGDLQKWNLGKTASYTLDIIQKCQIITA